MGISEQIEHDVAEAMRAKDELRLSTLRLIRAAIKNQEIEQRTKGAVDLDQLAITVVKRHLKQTQEAKEDYARGGRADLISKADAEIRILQSYLPQELPEEEILKIIDAVIAAAGAGANTGKLIGDVMKRIAGRADGARVRGLVESRLKQS